MTSAVLFDFYGTIATSARWPETPAAVLARNGYSLPPDRHAALRREMLEGLDHHEHSTNRQRYLEWDRHRLAELIDACDVPPPLVAQVISELWDARRPEALRVYPEAQGVLLGLRARGITVGLCSNWDWDLDKDVDELGLAACFDLIVSSARAGARKPNERIYRYTLERLGLPANEVLFVGDTLISDVDGPRRLGMRAVYLRRAAKSPWPGLGTWAADHGEASDEFYTETATLPPGVPRIADLDELANLVWEDGQQDTGSVVRLRAVPEERPRFGIVSGDDGRVGAPRDPMQLSDRANGVDD